jgi:ribose 5-phosphate isomerase B
MKVLFASDHAGFALKEILIAYVQGLGYETKDLGATVYEESDDYSDYISQAAELVSNNPTKLCAVVLGGSGQGEAMVANRFPHVRATVFYGEPRPKDGHAVPDVISLSREHNDANVLSLGARFLSAEEAQQAIKKWLETTFLGDERHVRRIKKIDSY